MLREITDSELERKASEFAIKETLRDIRGLPLHILLAEYTSANFPKRTKELQTCIILEIARQQGQPIPDRFRTDEPEQVKA